MAVLLAQAPSGTGPKPGSYDHAVATVFHSQSADAKAAIIRGALAHPTAKGSAAVLKAAASNPLAPYVGKVTPAAPKPVAQVGGVDLLHQVEHTAPVKVVAAPHATAKAPKPIPGLPYQAPAHVGNLPTIGFNPQHPGPSVVTGVKQELAPVGKALGVALHNAAHQQDVAKYAQKPGTAPSKLLPLAVTNSSLGPVFGGAKGAEQILKNAGRDAWNLPGGTVEGMYSLGKNIIEGHEGNAFHMLVDPYVQLLKNPGATFYQNPLNTALMLAGPKALAGHAAGALARSGALGDAAAEAASTAREPLHIGTVGGVPSPIVEARSFSRDLGNKAVQVMAEKNRPADLKNVAREPHPLVPNLLAKTLHIGSQERLNRIADEMTSTRQAVGRGERARVTGALHAEAKGVPKEAQPIVTHILQRVIRTPETADADIAKEIDRLKAVQPELKAEKLAQNKAQIRDLTKARATPGAVAAAFKVADKDGPTLQAQDATLMAKGLLDPEQVQRAKLFPYATAHMGAKYVHDSTIDPETGEMRGPALRKATGEHLSTEEILQHLKDNKVPDPSYVGHFPSKVAAFRFYKAYKLARVTLGTAKRTGEAFRTGAYDHSYEGLVGQVAHRAEAITNASLHDKVVSRLGIKKPQPLIREQRAQVLEQLKAKKITGPAANAKLKALSTGYFTPAEARAFADTNNADPNSLHLTPITAIPHNALDYVKDLQHPGELHDMGALELRQVKGAIDDAASRKDQARNVVMIPTHAASRFAEQFAKADSNLKSIGRVTQQFRRTVLPYSTHWMLQIGAEANLRALVSGALDPRYLADGRRMVKRLTTTEQGRDALSEMVNQTLYNKEDPLAVHNPNMGKIAAGAHAFPPTRALIYAHNSYANFIGHAMHGLEKQYRVMGLGKLSHQAAAEFSKSWSNAVRLQGHNLEHLAGKLESDPALVAKFGRQIDDTFGKYNKFSPRVRAAVQSYAPFLPWYLNAARFVLWQLPAKSPVASSLMASLRQTVNQDVADGKSLPLNAWAMQELSRLTPFNIFAPSSSTPSVDDALQSQGITDMFLPQITGALNEFNGGNAFGSGNLTGPHGDVKPRSGTAATSAAEELLESFLPLARYAREAEAGGQKTYGTSNIIHPQVKPGQPPSKPSTVINRIFNPLYSVQAEQKDKSAPAYAGKAPGASGATIPTIQVPTITVPTIKVPTIPGI